MRDIVTTVSSGGRRRAAAGQEDAADERSRSRFSSGYFLMNHMTEMAFFSVKTQVSQISLQQCVGVQGGLFLPPHFVEQNSTDLSPWESPMFLRRVFPVLSLSWGACCRCSHQGLVCW